MAVSPNLDYTTTDLLDPSVDINFDITQIPYPDNTFDVILCSHVLEHVSDDAAAMRELLRILKPGGWALLQVPIDIYRNETLEDPAITSPEDRLQFYWQEDHVRLYGLDYKDRLAKAGFILKLEDYSKNLDAELVERYGLDRLETLYFGVKPRAIAQLTPTPQPTYAKPPRVTVVIPCFNYGHFIQEAVESVLNQTFTDYEVIIVDDGSTDNTQEVLAPYCSGSQGESASHRIHYVYQPNQGAATTRNHGLRLAQGEFIIFLDADDFFLPTQLADQLACFEANPALGAVVSGWRLVSEQRKPLVDLELWKTLPDLTPEAWVLWRPVLPSATLFRREWLEKIGGFRDEFLYAEDVECMLRLAIAGCKTDWCKTIGVCYRQHGTSMTQKTHKQAERFTVLYDQFFAQADLSPPFQQLERKTRYHLLMWLAWRFYHTHCFGEMAQYLQQSLKYSAFSQVETIANWVESFSECCIGQGYELDAYRLSDCPEWKSLMQTVISTQKPRVSVVIPTYNNAKYLSQAIDSVLNQSFDSYEVVVIDDGSTDETATVLASYGDRIRVYHQQNRGVSATRNRGIQLAQGELVAFLDADDYFLPHKLLKQVQVFDAQPGVGIVNSGFQTMHKDGRAIAQVEWWRSIPDLSIENWLRYKPVLPSAMMFRRDWLEQVGGFDPHLSAAEDLDLVLRLVAAGCQSAWLEAITVNYRLHDDSACSQNTPKLARSAETVLHRFFAQPELPPSVRSLKAFSYYQTLVWSAWRLYCTGYHTEMGDYLQKSLHYSPYSRIQTVENWVESFAAYSKSFGNLFNPYRFSGLPEWQQAVDMAIGTEIRLPQPVGTPS